MSYIRFTLSITHHINNNNALLLLKCWVSLGFIGSWMEVSQSRFYSMPRLGSIHCQYPEGKWGINKDQNLNSKDWIFFSVHHPPPPPPPNPRTTPPRQTPEPPPQTPEPPPNPRTTPQPQNHPPPQCASLPSPPDEPENFSAAPPISPLFRAIIWFTPTPPPLKKVTPP